MSSPLISFLAAVLLLGATTTDPIDRLVAELASDPMWENGTSPDLDLPKTATTEEVVAKAFRMAGFSGKGTNYKILEIRKVHIRGSLP